MHRPSTLILCLLLPIVTCSMGSETIEAPAQLAHVHGQIEQWLEQSPTASVSVAVSRNGKTIWQQAFGFEDAAKPASVKTIYPMASVTKPFTAIAVMLLVQRGQLTLDKAVEDVLDQRLFHQPREHGRPVTVLDLLRHTSGLGMYYNNVYFVSISAKPKRQEIRLRSWTATGR